MQQSAQPIEHLVLLFGASLFSKGVLRIARETAREVATHIAVGTFLSAIHQHLGAIIKLRYAVNGEQER